MAERFAAYLRRATTRKLNTSGIHARSPSDATEVESSSTDFAPPNESVPLLPSQRSDIDSIESVNVISPDEIDDGIFPSSFQWKDVRASIRAKKPTVDLLRKRARYYVPILSWLPKYQWKANIVSDRTNRFGFFFFFFMGASSFFCVRLNACCGSFRCPIPLQLS
jgi:hypothetical protein